MTDEELQKLALSILEHQREKAQQQKRLLLNSQQLTSPKKFALEAFVKKHPRQLKSGKTHPPGE